MQPYFFPYIGYFQLIHAVDKFVFYDDVNFIKAGWINRNRILIQHEPRYINLELQGASSNKDICDISILHRNLKKKIKTIEQNYINTPYFEETKEIIENYFQALYNINDLATAAALSVKMVCEYLKLNKTFEFSSNNYNNTKDLDKADRLIEICKINQAKIYINPTGGKSLYNKEYFLNKGINLFFIQNQIDSYKQYSKDFVPGLSIIDVLMFNSIDEIHQMLNHYELQ